MTPIEGETLKKSYISYNVLRLPIMLEWQKRIGCHDAFLALGFLGGLDEPTPVPQRDINRMLGTVEETEFEENLDCPYLVNDTVKVMEGPFSGFSGVIEEINTEKRKLKVTVKIFGRKTPLELGFMQVEKE